MLMVRSLDDTRVGSRVVECAVGSLIDVAKRLRMPSAIRENNLTVTVIAGAILLVGLGLLWWSSADVWGGLGGLQSVVSQAGGLLVATAVLAVVWEHFGRRAFASEVMEIANVGADVEQAGIVKITDQYLDDVAWNDLIVGCMKVDIVVAYARTWRGHHLERLRAVAKRKDTRLRVFLPNPDDARTMEILAARFGSDVDGVRAEVRGAITDFCGLASPGGGVVEVWVRPGDVVFSCYRFDQRAVLTLYSHAKRRTSVPTFVMKAGTLWTFVYGELQAIRGQSTLTFPAPAGDE
jgi:hypothetical protein